MTESKHNQNATATPFRVAFVLLPKFSSLTLSCLVEPLRIANYCAGRELYRWSYVSTDGAAVPGCSGYSIVTASLSDDFESLDAIIVCGGWNAERFESAVLHRWLRSAARQRIVIGAAEMGSYVLARAGLLSGYAATIHWHCRNAFGERFPDIDIREQLFVIDRKRMTCAGGTACLDMMLHDIKERFGATLATEVAEQVVFATPREGRLPQRDALQSEHGAVPKLLRQAIEIMEANVEQTIKIPKIAAMLGLSQRKLERLFNKHFGASAVAYYRRVRLQRARVLLTQTDMSVLDICIACGFASSSYFSKSYAEEFGLRPRDHRLAWPDTELSPYWPGLHFTRH
ncbi:MAG: GlxA family transcriptional regulator [Gammaproteobacteria bacterium]|nr:GlxA family transcriptional regulator [Gammaproteobacteria bacterium]